MRRGSSGNRAVEMRIGGMPEEASSFCGLFCPFLLEGTGAGIWIIRLAKEKAKKHKRGELSDEALAITQWSLMCL